MTSKTTKLIFSISVFIFLVILGAVGIAGLFNKVIIQRKLEEVVTTETREEGTEPEKTTTPTTSPKTNNTTTTPKTTTPTTPKTTTPTGITKAQVATHNTQGNCWVIISNVAYNLSSYSHSGPQSHILCGQDNTSALSREHGLGYISFFASLKLGNVVN